MSRERQGVYGRPPSEQVRIGPRIEQLSESDWTSRFVRGAYRVTWVLLVLTRASTTTTRM